MGGCSSAPDGPEPPLDGAVTGSARRRGKGRSRSLSALGPSSSSITAGPTRRSKTASNVTNKTVLKGPALRKLVGDEAAARLEVASAEDRQRKMHTFDFQQRFIASSDDNVHVPGSVSVTVCSASDADVDDDRPRRSTMNSQEYLAAKNMRSVLQSKRDHVTRTVGAISPLSMGGVRLHQSEDDCWVVIRRKVYNVTSLLDSHPGGAYAIFQHAGMDATRAFDEAHPVATRPTHQLEQYFIGDVDDDCE